MWIYLADLPARFTRLLCLCDLSRYGAVCAMIDANGFWLAARRAFPVGKDRSGFMSRLPSNRSGQSFIEFALIIILFAIVLLSILLILGDDLRTFINDLLQTWFPG
jgi:Flp pilus assembly pilin Flp